MFVCMCVCVGVYVHVGEYFGMHVCFYMRERESLNVYVCTCVCMCIYSNILVCMYVCMCARERFWRWLSEPCRQCGCCAVFCM